MPELVLLAFIAWITAGFIAGWFNSLRTGVASLVGPYVRVRRADNPIAYFAALAVLLIPVAAGVVATGALIKEVFPYQSIGSPPREGYAKLSPSASELGGYFPTTLTRTTYQCAGFPRPVPIIGQIEVDWYSKALLAAGEPSLLPQANSGKASRNTYRFLWLRSFDKPIVVRIQDDAHGGLFMSATRLSGAGGYGPRKVEARVERDLSPLEAGRFRDALHQAKRLQLKPVSCERGMDGADWVFEAADGGAYRYVNRWSPRTGPVRALGLKMLSFTGWPISPIY